MTVHLKCSLGAAALLISTAQFAWADLTPQDVWSDWKAYMSSVGYDVSGTENQSGDTLTISDFSMSMILPDDEGKVTFDMSALVFAGQGDGTVAVGMPDVMPLHFTGKDGVKSIDVTVNYSQSGHSMTVSGDPGHINYDYNASQVVIALASLLVDGEAMPSGMARASVTMNNLVSASQMKVGSVREYAQTMAMDSLTYDLAFDDPNSDDGGTFTGSFAALTFKGDGVVPANMGSDDFQAMLEAGFAFDGVFEYASGNMDADVVGDGDAFTMKSSSRGGRFGAAMNRAHISYDLSQKGTSIEVTTDQLPFPITAQLAESGFKFDMPVGVSDEEQGFTFALTLRDFTTAEMIWGMIDPGSVLPRDPATVILDLTGKVKVLASFLNPEVLADLSGPPGEIHALTINELLVSAIGAKLSGSGDFTFNNADLATFGGFPAPAGVANIELSGANGVMDKLIQMGLLGESEAMPARMMMGMFAVPGDGEDTLVSKIEITEDGHISANGQRIR